MAEPKPNSKKDKILLKFEDYQALKEKADKADEYFDRLLRKQADFDNYKKRLEKEKIDFIRFANVEIISEILKILDDFERAMEAGKARHDYDSICRGVEMIWKDLKQFLKSKGLKEIEAKGRPFNPHEHEAMMQEETDEYPENYVIEELQKGYLLNDYVLRPAKVKVAKSPEKAKDK